MPALHRITPRRPICSAAGLLGALSLVIAAVGCEANSSMSTTGDPPVERASLEAGQIRYVLAWDLDGIAVADDGGWSLRTDLGYTVTVTRGWVTSYQVSLASCGLIEGTLARHAPRSSGRHDLGRALWSLIGGVAHAGHDDEDDPSTWPSPQVEPLNGFADLELGVVEVPAQTYCKAHYLVGRADDDAVNVPTEVDYDRVSLHLEGTWQVDGGEPQPLVLVTDFNFGKLLTMYPEGQVGDEQSALRLDPTEAGIELVITRRLAGWFDGVDFALLDDQGLAIAILDNLTHALTAEIWTSN